MPTEFCVFLRFPSKEPSFFDIPEIDNPDLFEKAVESAALEFEPREKDEGFLSVWKAKTDREEESLNAGFAARRNKCQTLICLRLPIEFLESAGIAFKQDPVDDAFSCIAHLHYLLGMASETDRKKLVKLIISRLQDGSLDPDALRYRIRKSDITPLLKKVYKRCCEEGVNVELERAEAWAQTVAEEVD
jgi:hypothetical protein